MTTTPDPARLEALAIWDREIAGHPDPILCSLCPTVNGVRPIATVRCWFIVSGPHALIKTARQYCLCEPCHREARERGDLVPGAVVEVL